MKSRLNWNCERILKRGLKAMKRCPVYADVFCVYFTVIAPSIMQLIVPTSEHFRQDQHQIASGGAILNSFSAISFLL